MGLPTAGTNPSTCDREVHATAAPRGGPRRGSGGDAERGPRRGVRRGSVGGPDADVLRIVPASGEWEGTDESSLSGLRGYRRAVRFGDGVAHLRTKLLYGPSRRPDVAAIRSLFVTDAVGPDAGPDAVEALGVTRAGDAAVVSARAPPSAFTE